MDWSLPRTDGLTALRRTREHDELRPVPVVFVSGHAHPAWPREALAAGCCDYLVKPFEVEQLERLLAIHLKAAAQAQAQRSQHQCTTGAFIVNEANLHPPLLGLYRVIKTEFERYLDLCANYAPRPVRRSSNVSCRDK